MSVKKGLFSYNEVKKGWLIKAKDPQALLKLAENTYKFGVKKFDCFSPFPIHGLDKVMRLPNSSLPFVVFVLSVLAGIGAFAGMTYIDVISWPINLGGKPNFAWPAYLPIVYEIITMVAGFVSVGFVIVMGRLWITSRNAITPDVTSDSFVLWIGEDIKESDVKDICQNWAENIEKIG